MSGKKVQPGVENAVKIAKVLGVSVEYLADENKSDPKGRFDSAIPAEYKEIIDQYRNLNPFNKKTVKDVLDSLSSRQ